MNSTRARSALLIGVIVVAVAAFVLFRSDNGSKSSSTAGSTTIVVRGEQPQGGVKKIDVAKGGTVRFSVQSDSPQEIHVHGYNVHKDVPANGKVSFSFPAKIDGVFVIELEKPGVQIGSLKVTP